MTDPQRDSAPGRRSRSGVPGRDIAYHRLLEALGAPGCPVCSLRRVAVHRYLDGVLYESVNDVNLRRALIRSRGFCPEHAWELVDFADSLGTAIIYTDQIARALGDVQDARGRSGGKRSLAARDLMRRRAPEAPCPACRVADDVTMRYLSVLIQHIGQTEIRQAIEGSSFLCLPDVLRALEISLYPDEKRVILGIVEGKLARLHTELAELIRKCDYRFTHEPKGEEQTSWFRAVGQLVGWRPSQRR
jgi:uncharacterized protein DUF6062